MVSRVISTLIGVRSKYNCSYLTYNPNTKSHDPLSRVQGLRFRDFGVEGVRDFLVRGLGFRV